MELRILSDVQAIHGIRGPLALTPTRKLLLGALLSEPKRTFDKSRLLELTENGWQENTRDKAIADLRAFLQENFAGQADLIGASGTLRLDLADPEVLDYHRFQRLVRQARSADDENALQMLSSALDEFRGTPLGGLRSAFVDRIRLRIDQQQRNACLERAELRLRLRQYVEALDEAFDQLKSWPEDERLIRILVRALVAVGRRSDASKMFTEFDTAYDASADLHSDVARILMSSRTATSDPRITPKTDDLGPNVLEMTSTSAPDRSSGRRERVLGWGTILVTLVATVLMSVRGLPSLSGPESKTRGSDAASGTSVRPPARPPMVLVYRSGDEPEVAAGRTTGQDHTWFLGVDDKKELETVFRTSYPNEPVERIAGSFEVEMNPQSPCPPVALVNWSLLVDGEERVNGSFHFPASGGNLLADIRRVPRDLRIRLWMDSPVQFGSATPCNGARVTLRDATVIPQEP